MTWPQEMVTNALDNEQGRPRIVYPPPIEQMINKFNFFYATKHNGRRLTWLPSMGTADIRAKFPAAGGRVHELNVSTYAMIILWLFNDLPPGEYLTCQEIQARTNIPRNDLARNLQSLAVAQKTRILRKDPMTKDIKDDDKFYFNDKFHSPYHRIKVGVVASANRVESEREKLKTEKTNDETRRHVCEAAIVRIMK
jgi:cullin 3